VYDTFKWDAAYMECAAEAFLWKEKRSAEDEVPCDDAGKVIAQRQPHSEYPSNLMC
jgi:hypothetical protein